MTSSNITIGIDVGGTKILGVVLLIKRTTRGDSNPLSTGSFSLEIIQELREKTPNDGLELIDSLFKVVSELKQALSIESPVPVGVGVPGLVDHEGSLRFSPNLTAIRSLPVAKLLAEKLAQPVFVDNDATCALRAEYLIGSGSNYKDVLLVTLGTGIGGGIVSGGEIVTGAYGFAGEIGHMVVDPFGPICPCGRRGCWERYASGSGLGRLGREAGLAGVAKTVVELAGGDPESIKGEHVTAAALAGDLEALGIVKQFGWWIALGLANLASALDPAVIVMGGGVVDAKGVWLDASKEAFSQMLEGLQYRPEVPIEPAKYGSFSGAVGAALYAFERIEAL
ncbi:MAG: ROK family protein [Acidimicrobiales bacterium]|nr:ROK family protein [Acidimicrobiales bacterium]